jgi:hypothetical protein
MTLAAVQNKRCLSQKKKRLQSFSRGPAQVQYLAEGFKIQLCRASLWPRALLK